MAKKNNPNRSRGSNSTGVTFRPTVNAGVGTRTIMSYNIEALPQYRRGYTMQYSCPVCGWECSEEAAKDEVWSEVLEEIASEHGISVECDGTDVFLTWERECEDDDYVNWNRV